MTTGVTGPIPTPFLQAPLYSGAGFDEIHQNRTCRRIKETLGETLSPHTNPSQTPRLVNTISASPVFRSVLLAVLLFSPSRPRRALVPSAPVRGLYYKQRTDHGRQPALLSRPPAPCSGGSLKSNRIIRNLSAFDCRFLGPNTR